SSTAPKGDGEGNAPLGVRSDSTLSRWGWRWAMGEPVAVNDGHGEQPAGGMPARLSMVVLSARNLPALRRFYRALGWSERAGASDTLSTFQLGDIALTLYPHVTS